MAFVCKSLTFIGSISHKGSTGETVSPNVTSMIYIGLKLDIVHILNVFKYWIQIILINDETDVRKGWHIIWWYKKINMFTDLSVNENLVTCNYT